MTAHWNRHGDGTLARHIPRKDNAMRKIIVAAVMGSLLMAAAACNTVKGAGRDIQSVGQAGSEAIH